MEFLKYKIFIVIVAIIIICFIFCVKYFSNLVALILNKIFNKKMVNIYFVRFLVKNIQKKAMVRFESNHKDAFDVFYDELKTKIAKSEDVDVDDIFILCINKIN